jgi:hypothetical protein
MTTKAKQGAVAAKAAAAKAANIELAAKAGQHASAISTMRIIVNEACKALKAAGVTIGKLNECDYAKAFIAERFKGKAASDNTKSVILSAFRKAVATGEDYNENASKTKAAAKKKAAKAATKQAAPKDTDAVEADETETKTAKPKTVIKPAKDDDTTIVLSLPRKATAKQAAKQMRAFIEKMRQSESLAPLAAYIVDVLDEFDGTAEQF